MAKDVRYMLAVALSLVAVLCIASVLLYAVHHGHDGFMVASGCGAIGGVAGWTGRKVIKE